MHRTIQEKMFRLDLWLRVARQGVVKTAPIMWLTAAVVVPTVVSIVLLAASAIAPYWKAIAMLLAGGYLMAASYSFAVRARR